MSWLPNTLTRHQYYLNGKVLLVRSTQGMMRSNSTYIAAKRPAKPINDQRWICPISENASIGIYSVRRVVANDLNHAMLGNETIYCRVISGLA
jgi:hypothetical protein